MKDEPSKTVKEYLNKSRYKLLQEIYENGPGSHAYEKAKIELERRFNVEGRWSIVISACAFVVSIVALCMTK
jgi:hypothetical protein